MLQGCIRLPLAASQIHRSKPTLTHCNTHRIARLLAALGLSTNVLPAVSSSSLLRVQARCEGPHGGCTYMLSTTLGLATREPWTRCGRPALLAQRSHHVGRSTWSRRPGNRGSMARQASLRSIWATASE
ncbi:hypothetical protein IQ07DRAFT_316777 [Pyrenochaeta sp. DS3sAY3a]|nr:hypothetical protein IQ07DRAFT_316777 [Pyrenochaeta sp. DS3sAY3a]